MTESATKRCQRNGHTGARFDGRNNAGHAIVFLYHLRLIFYRSKERGKIAVIIGIILSRKSYKRLLRRISQRDGTPLGKGMVQRDREPDMLSEQCFKPKHARRVALSRAGD